MLNILGLLLRLRAGCVPSIPRAPQARLEPQGVCLGTAGPCTPSRAGAAPGTSHGSHGGFIFLTAPRQRQEGNPRPPLSLSRSDTSRTLPVRGWKPPRHTCAGRGQTGPVWGTHCQPQPRFSPSHSSQPHRAVISCTFAPEETPKTTPSSAESVPTYTGAHNLAPGCWRGWGHGDGDPGGASCAQGTGLQHPLVKPHLSRCTRARSRFGVQGPAPAPAEPPPPHTASGPSLSSLCLKFDGRFLLISYKLLSHWPNYSPATLARN